MGKGRLGVHGEKPGWTPRGLGIGRSIEGGGDRASKHVGWGGAGGRKCLPEGSELHDPAAPQQARSAPRHHCLPSPLSLSLSRPAGPLCPGAAMPLPSSSPPRRTLPWGQSSSTRSTPAASTTSTKRSSACFPRCLFGRSGEGGAPALGGQCSQRGRELTVLALCGHAGVVGTAPLCPLHSVVLVLAGRPLRLCRTSSGVPGASTWHHECQPAII